MIQKAITIGLLLFVAASVAAPIERGLRLSHAEPTLVQGGPLPAKHLMVYYFHSHIRCPACRMVEMCSSEVCEQEFPDALTAGKLAWQAIDYQSPGNEHYVDDYQLLAASVVLVEFDGNRPKQRKTLHEAWNLTADRKALKGYLSREIQTFFEARP